jgi:hypothetical protein
VLTFHLGLSIYCLSSIALIFVPIGYFLSLSVELEFLISTIGIILPTTTIILVLFVPIFKDIAKGKLSSLPPKTTSKTSSQHSKSMRSGGKDSEE